MKRKNGVDDFLAKQVKQSLSLGLIPDDAMREITLYSDNVSDYIALVNQSKDTRDALTNEYSIQNRNWIAVIPPPTEKTAKGFKFPEYFKYARNMDITFEIDWEKTQRIKGFNFADYFQIPLKGLAGGSKLIIRFQFDHRIGLIFNRIIYDSLIPMTTLTSLEIVYGPINYFSAGSISTPCKTLNNLIIATKDNIDLSTLEKGPNTESLYTPNMIEIFMDNRSKNNSIYLVNIGGNYEMDEKTLKLKFIREFGDVTGLIQVAKLIVMENCMLKCIASEIETIELINCCFAFGILAKFNSVDHLILRDKKLRESSPNDGICMFNDWVALVNNTNGQFGFKDLSIYRDVWPNEMLNTLFNAGIKIKYL